MVRIYYVVLLKQNVICCHKFDVDLMGTIQNTVILSALLCRLISTLLHLWYLPSLNMWTNAIELLIMKCTVNLCSASQSAFGWKKINARPQEYIKTD